jgi:putative spermidine/putrescine transport system substrate-binding protein
MTENNCGITRRGALVGLAAGTALAPTLGGRAHAQQGRVVVGTWGGDYARLLDKNIDGPILKPKGIEVVQDQAPTPRAGPRSSPSAASRGARPTSRACRPRTCTR